jgi:LmbE family N-acetylglucosaminyl deacetylase
MLNRIIIISPHPDDETLGLGGTILKYKDAGAKIYWLNITNIKKEYGYSAEVFKKRQQEIKKVTASYKFTDTFNLNLKPASLDEYPMSQLVKKIAEIFAKVKPDTVFVPFQNDVHSDHRVVFNAVMSCTKSFRYPYIKKVLMYETLSETEFAPSIQANSFCPNVFNDITDYLAKKIKIMKIYESEINAHPFPRSEENIKALATFRGAMTGAEYAEAFMLIKEVW